MTERELRGILLSVDGLIDVYAHHDGFLSVNDVKVKSLLMVARSQVAAQIKQADQTSGLFPLDLIRD